MYEVNYNRPRFGYTLLSIMLTLPQILVLEARGYHHDFKYQFEGDVSNYTLQTLQI